MDHGRPRLDAAVDYGRLRSGLISLQARLPEVRETAESEDGLIRVTLGGRSELVALVLDPRIYRVPNSEALAGEIRATVHRAAAAVRERLYVLTRSLLSDPARAGSEHQHTGPETRDPSFDLVLAELDRRGRW
jgi:DNA-binding protein YbaB